MPVSIFYDSFICYYGPNVVSATKLEILSLNIPLNIFPVTVLRSVYTFDNEALNDATDLTDAAQIIFKGVQAILSRHMKPVGFSKSSYTTDMCNDYRTFDILDKESDRQPLLANPAAIFHTGSPNDNVVWDVQYYFGTISNVCNLNSFTSDGSYHFVQMIPNDQSLLADTLRQVFGQIIL